MKCRTVEQLLAAQVDGELEEPLRGQVEQHLQGCEACRESVAALRALRARLLAMGPAPAVPDGFAARVLAAASAQLDAAEAARRSAWWRPGRWVDRWAAVAATPWLARSCTVALAVVLGLLLTSGRRAAEDDTGRLAGGDRYGLEWFDPSPPGSIISAYLEVTTPSRTDRRANP